MKTSQLYYIQFFFILCLGINLKIVSGQSSDPNIILIYVDDLNDYTNYLEGHPQVETPNITSLAQNGVSFTNAYTNSPGCAPSRTSMLSGKDCYYTKVYNNEDYAPTFRFNFTEALGNDVVYTIPELLKNSGKYFTYSVSKTFHADAENDFDKVTTPDCNKTKSWNRYSNYQESTEFISQCISYSEFWIYGWGIIPDSLESNLDDVRNTDTAIQFIHDVANGIANTCDKPFFLSVGLHRPHTPRLLPEKYFLPYYKVGFDSLTNIISSNTSEIDSGYNGVVSSPQPIDNWADYYALPEGGIGRRLADEGDQEPYFNLYLNSLDELPIIDSGLSYSENFELLLEGERAKYVMGYLAAAKFVDAQIGRLLDTLQQFPDLYNNTIIILTSDHGYSLGEKKHYTKWALWDTDIRVPLIFSGPDIYPGGLINKEVSHIDLMPTICELAGVTIPDMPDGTNYEDGTSFLALLANPTAYYNKPVLSSYIKKSGLGSCNPQYSIRHNGYQYIRYHHNNNSGTTSPCDLENDYYEEELYYLGVNREVDPYEWNNLASDSTNRPIMNYLETFFPGNYNYLKSSMNVEFLISGSVPCFISNTGKLKMQAKLFSTTGIPLSSVEMNNYNFIWTNSATASTKTGIRFGFNLSSIPPSYYTSNSTIRFYLTVKNKITGNIVAFRMKELAINPSNNPTLDFSPELDNHLLSINDVEITGSFKSVIWDLGDGTESNFNEPLDHIYAGQGAYTINQIVNYGNNCSLQKQKTVYIIYAEGQICEGESYTLPDGVDVTEFGNYTSNLTSIAGTDSVILSHVNVLPLYLFDTTVSIIEGESYLLPDGSIVTEPGTYYFSTLDINGCDSTIITHIEIEEVELKVWSDTFTTISVAPNPFNDILYINRNPVNTETEIRIFGINGQLMSLYYMEPESIQLEIPVSNYPSAVYIIRVIESGNTHTFRVIKTQ